MCPYSWRPWTSWETFFPGKNDGALDISVVDPDPHPDLHRFDNLDPHPHPDLHQIKIRIWIRIRVK
jgi:hypothetical protein